MKKAHSVILNQSGVSLVASVFATRNGIASATKVDEYADGYAVKVTVTDQFGEGDFVVRSVRYDGSRRKLEVLFGVIQASVARSIPAFASVEENDKASFAEGDIIWLTDGDELVTVSDVVTIAAHKKVS